MDSHDVSIDDVVQLVQDEQEIRNLVARVAHLADMDPDLVDYLDCFTDDAVWEFPGSARENLGHSRTEGRDQIAADRRARRADGFQGPGTNTRHVNTTLAVRVDGSDTAEAESYWLFVGDTLGSPVLRGIGHYNDRFTRTPQGWKLSSRQITPG
ncbi:MAG TPA: nuclear transport factor 2 family protein [Acidimicrobiales bacterium]